MRLRILATCVLLSAPMALSAEKATFQGGLTLGVTTPGPMRWLDRRLIAPYPDPTERNSSLASPLAGVDGRLTLWDHLAIDIGLHGSETGYRHEHSSLAGQSTTFHYQERMRLRRLALPLTVGYSFRLGRMGIRAGVGYSLTYFLSGLYQTETRVNGGLVSMINSVDLFADDDNYRVGLPSSWKVYPRWQAQFRAKLDVQTSARWMFGFAASSGHPMNIYSIEPRSGGPANYVYFASDAYELTVTYMIRMKR